MVQAMPSSQVLGQAFGAPSGIPGSQCSPSSSTPLPHAAGQSMSLSWVAPAGQQLSGFLPDGVTIGDARSDKPEARREGQAASS